MLRSNWPSRILFRSILLPSFSVKLFKFDLADYCAFMKRDFKQYFEFQLYGDFNNNIPKLEPKNKEYNNCFWMCRGRDLKVAQCPPPQKKVAPKVAMSVFTFKVMFAKNHKKSFDLVTPIARHKSPILFTFSMLILQNLVKCPIAMLT